MVTNTYSEYVILIAFLQQQRLRERPSLFGYTYIAYLFIIYRFKMNNWRVRLCYRFVSLIGTDRHQMDWGYYMQCGIIQRANATMNSFYQ